MSVPCRSEPSPSQVRPESFTAEPALTRPDSCKIQIYTPRQMPQILQSEVEVHSCVLKIHFKTTVSYFSSTDQIMQKQALFFYQMSWWRSSWRTSAPLPPQERHGRVSFFSFSFSISTFVSFLSIPGA